MFDAEMLPEFDKATMALCDERTFMVLNKIDEPIDFSNKMDAIAISVKTGQGMDAFLQQLTRKVSSLLDMNDSPVITRARYREHLQRCNEQLASFHLEKAPELAAEDLRIAAQHLGMITGRIDVDTLLDKIFSSFCIGK